MSLRCAYILQRLAADPSVELVLGDDIEVFDARGNAIEAVHVGEPDDAFFARARERLRGNPEMIQRIVTPVALRPISRAVLEDGGFSRKQADALGSRFVIETCAAANVTPPELEAWLRRAKRVTAVDVRERSGILGRLPVKPGIAEGPRDEAIDAAFERSNVVVVHGGIREYGNPSMWEYVDGDLRTLARAAREVGVPLLVRVQPKPGWTGVVEELRAIPGVSVLANVPESYWLRARATGATLLYADVRAEGDQLAEEPADAHAALLEDARRYAADNADLIAEVRARIPSEEVVWAILDPAGLGLDESIAAIPDLREWHAGIVRRRPAPVPRDRYPAIVFPEDADIAAIEDDGEHVVAHWIAPLEDDDDLERESVRRLDALRRRYPDRRTYTARAHGVAGEVKRTIPAESFPDSQLLRTHLVFARAGAPRAESFDDYAEEILALRRRVVTLANRITGALTTYFRRDKPIGILDHGVSGEEWDAITAALTNLPKFPRSAVDDWGYETEGPLRAWSAGMPHAHVPYTNALSTYANALTDFLGSSWQIFAANPQIGRGTPEAREKLTEWLASEKITPERATERLADAIQLLKRLQSEFRARFASPELEAFERQEHAALWQLWAVWYDFAYHPRRRIENAARDSVAAIDVRIEERRRSLRRKLRALEQSKTELVAENEEGLWLAVDVRYVPLVVSAFAEALVKATEVLRPQPESTFDRYVFDLVWQHINLVPLVRGRSLARKTWRLRIIGLPLPGDDVSAQAWKFVQRSISGAMWDRLGLASWSRAVGPDARRFLPSVNAWRDSIAHLANLRDVPRNDEHAIAVVTSHWRDVVAVADRQAADVERVIAAIPSTLFSKADDAVAILQKFTTTLRATIASAEPLSFDAMAEAKDAIADTLVQAASAIADVWLDGELPNDAASQVSG